MRDRDGLGMELMWSSVLWRLLVQEKFKALSTARVKGEVCAYYNWCGQKREKFQVLGISRPSTYLIKSYPALRQQSKEDNPFSVVPRQRKICQLDLESKYLLVKMS